MNESQRSAKKLSDKRVSAKENAKRKREDREKEFVAPNEDGDEGDEHFNEDEEEPQEEEEEEEARPSKKQKKSSKKSKK